MIIIIIYNDHHRQTGIMSFTLFLYYEKCATLFVTGIIPLLFYILHGVIFITDLLLLQIEYQLVLLIYIFL